MFIAVSVFIAEFRLHQSGEEFHQQSLRDLTWQRFHCREDGRHVQGRIGRAPRIQPRRRQRCRDGVTGQRKNIGDGDIATFECSGQLCQGRRRLGCREPRTSSAPRTSALVNSPSTDSVTGVTVRWVVRGNVVPSGCVDAGCLEGRSRGHRQRSPSDADPLAVRAARNRR